MRRVGVLVPNPEDPVGNARVAAFRQALDLLGWTVGRNLQIDVRWAAGDAEPVGTRQNWLRPRPT